jgi:hypothetical protein
MCVSLGVQIYAVQELALLLVLRPFDHVGLIHDRAVLHRVFLQAPDPLLDHALDLFAFHLLE